MAELAISVTDHLGRILDSVSELAPYAQPVLEAIGLPVSEDVRTEVDLPGFDNSAVDGYAVAFLDTADATGERPTWLPVVGEIAAGDGRPVRLTPGTAIRIMTGAPIPEGSNAVVPLEWTEPEDDHIRILRAPEEGQHLRYRGEDVAAGEVVMRAGEVVGPRHVGLLASIGRARVNATSRPRVVVMSTGDELREPGSALGAGQIYDSNSYLLTAQARAAGALAYRVTSAVDDPDAFAGALADQLVRADLLITSGGVSKGAYDIVKQVLTERGDVQFDEVAMQPGKPQGFGFVGEENVPIFTLPGNPVSSYVSFEVFVLPALRKMMGRDPLSRPVMRATVTAELTSPPKKRQYVRARYETGPEGAVVTPVGGHGSHLIGDLAAANALIVVSESQTYVAEGSPVPVLVLDRAF